MAHRFMIKTVPYIKADGTESASKKAHEVWDRTRGKRRLLGTFSSRKQAEESLEKFRENILTDHLKNHPNDSHFKSKHNIPSL